MLNGKFFTGLPPKMIDRRGVSTNRQESHFFWPDDTQVDSVAETRGRRRSSLQMEKPPEKPRLQHQNSLGQHDVDTRQRFQKEFAKSSIQFCDNIPEESGPYQQRQKSSAYASKFAKPGITPKPTALKMPLPESVVDEQYTNAKKKQAYTSKIFFNDYEEDANTRNNIRKPKMDMNDKKEVERNTKNSPKLQVKRNVSNLSAEMRRNNDYMRDQCASDYENVSTPQKIIRNDVFDERGTANVGVREVKRTERTFHQEHEIELPEHNIELNRLEEPRSNAQRSSLHNVPKKILKKISRDERMYNGVPQAHHYEPVDEISYIDNSMRNMRVRTSPKKHVTYRDETSYENEVASARYYDEANGEDVISSTSSTSVNSRTPTVVRKTQITSMPNTQAGSHQRRQPFRANTPDFIDQYQYMETGNDGGVSGSSGSGFAMNNNNSLSNNYNHNSVSKMNNQAQTLRKISPKVSATTTTTTVNETSASSAADAQKHLRSSLSFHGGEIVADNGAATKTPTANYRRFARSTATQRVSVGLPD